MTNVRHMQLMPLGIATVESTRSCIAVGTMPMDDASYGVSLGPELCKTVTRRGCRMISISWDACRIAAVKRHALIQGCSSACLGVSLASGSRSRRPLSRSRAAADTCNS